MAHFSLEDVLEVEREVMTTLDGPLPDVYFKEPVAQILFSAWKDNPADTRLLVYTFPLIQSMMNKNTHFLKTTHLEECEIFNILSLKMLQAFPKYSPERGRLFTFATLQMHWRIKDLIQRKDSALPLEDWDRQVDDFPSHILADFKAFLFSLAAEQGPTACRILTAFLEILDDDTFVVYSQNRLKDAICARTGLPRVIVYPYYLSLLTRWEHSVLD